MKRLKDIFDRRPKIGIAYVAYLSNEPLYELALAALKTFTSEEHRLVFSGWLNHSVPPEWRAKLEEWGPVHDNDENCLSRGWNRGITELLAQGCEFVFVPNLDVEVSPGAIDELASAARQRQDFLLWTMAPWPEQDLSAAPRPQTWVPYPHFSAFMLNQRTIDTVGLFDENFKPAYNEDLDYHWRIHLAGYEAAQFEGARFYHYGSATIKHDEAIRESNNITHGANDAYFVRKWGMKPATCCDQPYEGLFTVPFNGGPHE